MLKTSAMSSSHIPSDFFTAGWHNGTRSVVALVRLSLEMGILPVRRLVIQRQLDESKCARPRSPSSIQRPLRICAIVFKALSAMFLGSGIDNFSHASFTKGSNLNMIGITAAGFSTTLHMLANIQTTNSFDFLHFVVQTTWRAREASQRRQATAHSAQNAACQVLHVFVGIGDRLGIFHNEGHQHPP